MLPARVTTPKQVTDNIRAYQRHVGTSRELQARLGKTLRWYAIRDGHHWLFAPSKFVGYVGMTAEIYLGNYNTTMDGRESELVLQTLFDPVERDTALYRELYAALETYLAQFSVRVSRRAADFRIAPETDSVKDSARRVSGGNHLDRVVSDPGICGGRPRIRGTRVRVVDIMEMLADGMSHADVLADFPYLAGEDIAAALSYSARAVDHAIIRAA